MSGIPVYTSSPINASKAEAVSPQTTSPASNPGPPATTSISTSSYPPAKPGQAAIPAPTGSAQRYAPLQPTSTTKSYSDGPPAPQPGAVPVPPSQGFPPPPKVGEKFQPQTSMPPQMAIAPPSSAFGYQVPSSTGTSTTPSTSYPVPVPASEYGAPRQSIEHPPGYQQDTQASELTPDQRQAQYSANPTSNGSEGVGGIDTESIWNTAKQWASTAGSKISETEQEIWRRINKE